jgi:hypothetical protein
LLFAGLPRQDCGRKKQKSARPPCSDLSTFHWGTPTGRKSRALADAEIEDQHSVIPGA